MNLEEEIISSFLISQKCQMLLEELKKALNNNSMNEITKKLEKIRSIFDNRYDIKITLRSSLGKKIASIGSIISDITVEYPINDNAFLQITINPKIDNIAEFKVLFLGLQLAGKTTMAHSIKEGYFRDTSPTIGKDLHLMQYRRHKISINDIGGHLKYRSLWIDPENSKCHVIVYVIDSGEKITFNESLEALKLNILDVDVFKNKPIIVAANKQDLPESFPPEQISEIFQLQKILQNRKWAIFGTSALIGVGLLNLLEKIYFFASETEKTT